MKTHSLKVIPGNVNSAVGNGGDQVITNQTESSYGNNKKRKKNEKNHQL